MDQINHVYSTTNYDRFSFAPANRPIDPRWVGKLAGLMIEYGYDPAEPIIVNSDFVVDDGQHRLLAAREADVAVCYMISDAKRMPMYVKNAAVHTWSDADYLHHFCVMEKTEYQKLDAFVSDRDWLTLSGALDAAGYAGAAKRQYKHGDFVFPSQGDKFFTILAALEIVSKHTPWSARREAISALRQMVKHPKFDLDVWRSRVDSQPRSLVPCRNADQYLVMFVDIYNYRSRTNRIGFDFSSKPPKPI